MKLMLVESPHKAKVIGGFLGSGWKVMATIGSMFDIQGAKTAAEKAKYDTYGISTVDWERNLKTSNAKQLGLIKSALTGATDLYVATDPDRAGEQIGHEVVAALAPVIKKNGIKVWRVTWNEITKQAVQDGLKNRGSFNDNMIDAAVARQVYDRLFGYSVSPAIWKNVSPGLSGGRVQSPTLRLIVNREKERLAFVSVTYLSVEGAFTVDTDGNDSSPGSRGGRESLTASLIEVDGARVATGASFNDKGEPRDGVLVLEKKDWAALKKSLSAMTYSVVSVSSKPYRRRPPAPYTTSSFQQAVGNALGMSSSRVMGIAQKLYDAGLVTYTRTDSPAMSAEGTAAARAEALRLHPNSVPAQPNYYKAKSKNAQEGHEAIRPTATNGKFTPPSALSRKLTADELDVYTMIYKRAVASQMTDAVGLTKTVDISGDSGDQKAVFRASGVTYTDRGWMSVHDKK